MQSPLLYTARASPIKYREAIWFRRDAGANPRSRYPLCMSMSGTVSTIMAGENTAMTTPNRKPKPSTNAPPLNMIENTGASSTEANRLHGAVAQQIRQVQMQCGRQPTISPPCLHGTGWHGLSQRSMADLLECRRGLGRRRDGITGVGQADDIVDGGRLDDDIGNGCADGAEAVGAHQRIETGLVCVRAKHHAGRQRANSPGSPLTIRNDSSNSSFYLGVVEPSTSDVGDEVRTHVRGRR